MEQTPNTAPGVAPTPVSTTPTPVPIAPNAAPVPAMALPHQTHWGMVASIAVVLALIAAGAYAFITYGWYDAMMPSQQPAPAQVPPPTETSPTSADSLNTLEADLSASVDASSSDGVDALQQSL